MVHKTVTHSRSHTKFSCFLIDHGGVRLFDRGRQHQVAVRGLFVVDELEAA